MLVLHSVFMNGSSYLRLKHNCDSYFFRYTHIPLILSIQIADLQASLYSKKDGSDKGVLSPNATSYAPSSDILSKTHEKTGSPGDLTEGSLSGKANGETKSVNSCGTSSGSDSVGGVAASSGPGLSPSSSVGSLSSEKSTLNPNAKV